MKERTKSEQERIELMKAGLLIFKDWLKDIIREGLGSLPDKSSEFYERMFKTLNNYKLGSLERRLQGLDFKPKSRDENESLLDELALLFLFTESFQHLEKQPYLLQQDMLSFAGVNFRKKDIITEEKAVSDVWTVLSALETEEDSNLTSRKTYLYGNESRCFALLLEYAYGSSAGFETKWSVGSLQFAELVFYPSAVPLRAVVKNNFSEQETFLPHIPAHSFSEFRKVFAQKINAFPWLRSYPVLLKGVYPQFREGRRLLVSEEGELVPLQPVFPDFWSLLSLSGGEPLELFGEWDGRFFTPISRSRQGRRFELISPGRLQ